MTIRDVPPLAWKVPDIAPFEGLERNERIVTVDQLAETILFLRFVSSPVPILAIQEVKPRNLAH